MSSSEIFSSTALDRESLPQSSLDISERIRTNPFPWTGQFSPQLVEQLLVTYAPKDSFVLDPFAGSGTTLVEAARLGLAASGCDLNAAPVILSRIYGMANLNEKRRATALGELRERLNEVIAPPLGQLFKNGSRCPDNRAELESILVGLWRDSASDTVQDLAAALVVLCDFYRKNLDAASIHKTWRRLEDTVLTLPYSTNPIVMYQADARNLPISSKSVDLVLTSPPYINVHNYHQKYRRSVEALGWNVLSSAHSEIGSNRQNRGNRFLTVIQYSLDIALSLREMVRVSKSGARLILVIGRESKVRGTTFFNSKLVTEVAVRSVGLEIERRQERMFRNRYGNEIYEDILHFRSRGEVLDQSATLRDARSVAERTLSETRRDVPGDARLGIDDALNRLDTVTPSPILMTNSHN